MVDSFDVEKKAFWLTVYVSFTLRNILQDETYEDEIEILVAPDFVDGVESLGQMIESVFVCNEAHPARTVHFVSCPIAAGQLRFQEFVQVSIPPGSEAIHSYTFSGWGLEDVPFEFHAQRYSESVKVRVTNRTGAQITCILSRGTNNPTVAPDQLDKRTLTHLDSAVLKQNLVLDGNRDKLQLVIHQ